MSANNNISTSGYDMNRMCSLAAIDRDMCGIRPLTGKQQERLIELQAISIKRMYQILSLPLPKESRDV